MISVGISITNPSQREGGVGVAPSVPRNILQFKGENIQFKGQDLTFKYE